VGEMNGCSDVRFGEAEEIGFRHVKESRVCTVVPLHSCVLKVAGLAQIRRERDNV
jgi:hypothetical protein